MDNIKEKIEEIVEKISKDEKLQKQFKNDPVKALEKLLDVDLPDEVIEKIIDGVKAKLTVDTISDAVGMFKKLF
ncbi:MAG: hypothetical protein IKC46_15575 [Lachnospiraceae bacterium]|nr:hypothetical protein [Lachnospiraceae bacterium]